MKNKRQNITFNLKEAKRLMYFWQKELRLQDWDITLFIVSKDNLVLKNTTGTNTWRLGLKQSVIQLMDPKDYDNSGSLYDMEVTLVHELLHLTLAITDNQVDGDNNNGSPWYIEQAINQIAKALVNVKRNSL